MLAHELRLPALQVADEVPAERVAVGGVLGLEVLRPVLSDDLDSGLGQDAQLGDGEVLRRGHDRHLRPDLVPDAREPLAHLISGQAQ